MKCTVCEKQIKLADMRAHIGAHIHAGHVETDVCGFRGGPCAGPCVPQLSATGQAVKGCPLYKRYNAGTCVEDRAGCNNHIIKCDVAGCTDRIWSYNRVAHQAKKHGAEASSHRPVLGPLEAKYLESLKVKMKE